MANFGDNFVKNNAIRLSESGVRDTSDPIESEVIVPEAEAVAGQNLGRRILCVWFPNWPIQRLVVEQPEYRCQQVILFRRDSRRGQVVAAASPLAVKNGVCPEMPLSEAKSLLRSAGKFHVLEHDPSQDLKTIGDLADSMECFSPIVGLEVVEESDWKKGCRPDSILLDITGLAHLFGDESQLAYRVYRQCDQSGYLPRIAVGDTVAAAWAGARYLSGRWFHQFQEPLIFRSGEREGLKQIPVAGLRLGAAVTETLQQLGIETIGQVQQLSRHDLARRFGSVIHRRLDQMAGKLEEPVIARRKPATFQLEQLLEFPTHHRETIEVVIARLVTQLCEQMRSHQRGALEWRMELVCQEGPSLEFQVNLFQPTSALHQVMPLVEMKLEQVLSPHTRQYRKKRKPSGSFESGVTNNKTKQILATPGFGESKSKSKLKSEEPHLQKEDWQSSWQQSRFHRVTTIQVQEIKVSVTSDVLLVQQQRQLFDENPRLDQQSLAHLINRLAGRMGMENVVYPLLQSGAQPEYSYRWRPLVDPNRKQRRRRTKPPKLSHQLARPLRIFCPAHSVGVTGVRVQRDEESSGYEKRYSKSSFQPVAIQMNQKSATEKIIQFWGPERIETGWWRGRTVCRDYWRIEIQSGQHYWVYQDLRTGDWFLHGQF